MATDLALQPSPLRCGTIARSAHQMRRRLFSKLLPKRPRYFIFVLCSNCVCLCNGTNPKCLCDRMQDEGWSIIKSGRNTTGRCMRGVATTCDDCPEQAKCSTITTYAGNGLAAFAGDCEFTSNIPSVRNAHCPLATEASLAYPTAMVLDDLDNIYVADYKNNRVRMVVKEFQIIKTIAGSGQIGFSGDGHPGRRAALRRPEGVAFRRLNAGSREVFFSDVYNQRIRRVIETEDKEDWIIETVLGTGVRGTNSNCDNSCPSELAVLNNPRAIVFSEDHDLYIVDSGTRRILRLSSDLKTLSTFIGVTMSPASWRFDRASNEFLPGLWEQQNQDVALESLFAIQIDQEQNLWFVDSSSNRIFMAPTSSNRTLWMDGLAGALFENYMLHFVRKYQERLQVQESLADNFLVWMQEEELIYEPADKKRTTKWGTEWEVGRSYWRYGSGYDSLARSSWCPSLEYDGREKCRPVPVHEVKFGSIRGMCFDAANNLYMADMRASEVVVVRTSKQELDATNRSLTTKGTRCQNVCRVRQAGFPKQCCTDPRCREWGWCNSLNPLLSWSTIENVALLGSEIRHTETRTFRLAQRNPDWSLLAEYVSDSLLLSQNVEFESLGLLPRRSSFIGFQVNMSTTIPTDCNDLCCGLRKETAESVSCMFNTIQDLFIVLKKYSSDYSEILLQLEVPMIHQTREPYGDAECNDICGQTPQCKAFMVQWDTTNDSPKSGTECVFFHEAHPYALYTFNRSLIPENISSGMRILKGPHMVPSKFFEEKGVLIDGQSPFVLPGSPFLNSSLVLWECVKLCMLTATCKSIAFPGCYLLKWPSFEDRDLLSGDVSTSTAVILKRDGASTVTGLTGYPYIKTFEKGDKTRLAYLNRPLGCHFDSQRSLFILDTWNQRIRQVKKFHVNCEYDLGSNTKTDLGHFRDNYEAMLLSCRAALSDDFQRVFSSTTSRPSSSPNASGTTRAFREKLCVSPTGGLESYTNNLFVLCEVCKEIHNRPPQCPKQEICDCRHRLRRLLEDPVYTRCTAESAIYDEAHRWISAYTSCFSEPVEDRRWLAGDDLNALKTYLTESGDSVA
eukprot:TRINITY_DN2725_c0_g1_i1.p1 TRINITY_DN2725_c0_g1~~TRINITY_DN2725_c0_g1_i1.p1  ORF type:complete len:1073 (+),score=70.17 TRINITY_DN2725_c0_g1_i1:346-3564(+)